VYVACWGKAYGFDAQTGDMLWSIVLPGVGAKELILPPVVDGERVFILSESGVLNVIGTGDYDTITQTPHKVATNTRRWWRNAGAPPLRCAGGFMGPV